MSLNKLTCNQEQSQKLISLGVAGVSFLTHYRAGNRTEVWQTDADTKFEEAWPAWTKAELDAMIGPRFEKPDLWKEQFTSKSHDPNTYPIIKLSGCVIFKNGAEASAAALIFLLEENFLFVAEINERYRSIFLQ